MEVTEENSITNSVVGDANKEISAVDKFGEILFAIERLRDRFVVVSSIVGVSITIYVLADHFFSVDKIYQDFLVSMNKPRMKIIATAIIFILGITLYFFKQKQQFWYGFFETIFALMTCYFAIANINADSPPLSLLIALGSALYLIVRGLSNIADGREKEYWIKKEFSDVINGITPISRESIINALKDKNTWGGILFKLGETLSKY